ncbi:MAG: serine/threonine-protein kinase, partial [Gemmatimonadaceae bacterium]
MPDSAPNESPSGTRSAAWRRWASVQPILDAALDAAPEDRIRIVTEMCGDDAELFATVRELLAYSTAESELFRDEVAVAYPKFVSSVFRSVPVGSNTARNELRAALANRYDIERVLGVGGMATVYLARDIRHDRRVALKVMSPELASAVGSARFLAEITTTASLQHPHILPLHDSGEVNGTVFYVMPYVEGGSLRDRLHREKQLPIHDALAIAIGVLGALDHAHRKGFVHRDIKPENILLNDGQPLVADFGIALGIATRHQEARARLTEHGASIGTPTYMSPEQATGDRELDGRTDIFALSCVLYEMLAGEPPHVGATTAEIIAKVLTTPPVSPRVLRETIPPHIEDAILIALQKLPADRYSTAADFANALEHPARNRPKRSFENATISARSFHSRWPLTLSAAVLAALGVWGWMRPTSRQGAAPLTRFSFALNASLPIAEIAVAPDGEALVYVGGDSLVAGKLMLRRLDGEEPVAIPGTAGASQPFFSPDGLTIGFLQGGKLRRVSLASNEVSTLVDVAAMEGSTTLNQVMYGATWGPRDRIVFATPRGLYGVSASGGTPVRIALPDSSANQWYFQQPVFSHDGKDVLFGVVSRDYASHIAVMSTADRAIISLGVTGREPKFVAPSALVYTDADGRLFSIALDLPARRVVGQATKILDNVALSESPPRAYADISR